MNKPELEPRFAFFDRKAEVSITQADLPHWFQAGTAMFVTFRTADSIPAEVWRAWKAELVEWLQWQKLPTTLADAYEDTGVVIEHLLSTGATTISQMRSYRQLRDRLWHRKLDELHGECLLKNPALARIVAEAIRFYDGEKYDLDRLVVMPNHVHVLVQFREGSSLDAISQSWLRYTARQINAVVGRSGEFWQGEPFDHLVRSPQQFSYLQRYIAENPRKAKLKPGQYLFWQR